MYAIPTVSRVLRQSLACLPFQRHTSCSISVPIIKMPQQLPPEVIGIIVRYCQPRHSVLSSRIQLEREDVYKRLSQVNHTWRIYAKEEADQYLTIRIEEAWIPELGSDKTKYLSVTSETGDSFQVLPGDRYFSDDEEKSATGFFTVKVLQSVRNHLEEAYVPYINFQVLILLMKCNRKSPVFFGMSNQ